MRAKTEKRKEKSSAECSKKLGAMSHSRNEATHPKDGGEEEREREKHVKATCRDGRLISSLTGERV